jgi:acetylglutamate kinase
MTGVVVVKISGKPIDAPTQCAALWDALADAARTRSIVVVHGGGVAVDRMLSRLGLETVRRGGLRVTPEEHMPVIAGVLAGEVNTTLVGLLRARGVDAVGLCLGSGGLAACERHKPLDEHGHAIDLGRVGRVVGGDGRVVEALHRGGFTPVVSCVGLDASGRPLNVNADDAAAGIAGVLGAARLVLITDVPGVLGPDGQRLTHLDAPEIDRLIARGVIAGGMIPKVRAALEVSAAAHAAVVIGAFADATGLIAGDGSAGTVIRATPAALTPVAGT